jgi:hypothetical protein
MLFNKQTNIAIQVVIRVSKMVKIAQVVNN